MVLGATGHGKNTLAAALLGYRATIGTARASTIATTFSFVSQRNYVVDTPPDGVDVAEWLFSLLLVDVALVVVSLEAGVQPETIEQLRLARAAGVAQCLMVLNHRDCVPERELILLVREEARAAIESCGLRVAAEVSGSARDARDSPYVPHVDWLSDLVHELDRLPPCPRSEEGPFLMRLRERVHGRRGAIVRGVVERGTMMLEEAVELIGSKVTATCPTMMEVEGESVRVARAGAEVAALLRGIDGSDMHDAVVIATPGTVSLVDRLEVRLQCTEALTAEEPLNALLSGWRCVARPTAAVEAGESVVTLVFDREVVGHAGWPIVLRRDGTTVAIGRSVAGTHRGTSRP